MGYLVLFPFLFFTFTVYAMEGEELTAEFTSKISALENNSGGRLGVSVISANGSALYTYRENERFAMCSTFKALLGAAILSKVDSNLESLDRAIPYTTKDILDYAPITKRNLSVGRMTVSELSAASIQYSDNTAANLLLDAIGGPQALTSYLRSIGDNQTRLDRNEPSLNTNITGDLRDTSTPNAMAETLHKVMFGDDLSPASKEQLKAWMFGNTTGANKLKAGFNKFWIVGDKTGSCGNGASNDVAIVYPRGTEAFIISVFYTGSSASNDIKNAVIADVAQITSSALLNNH
ncbi:class A beta-lactamase [Paraglaciecola arctica]|uniref:Beta-lactamase n=1 Tax=Paraglaciecola arctica BSs20135 TaxID=493475 RepID=K6Z612_9ALTE|nr:class A beta-lactamase [Paraglaciecola arctica]GAC18865.1 beta-lactamase Toho-1 [Paraglaciecola arctica BSs20135]